MSNDGVGLGRSVRCARHGARAALRRGAIKVVRVLPNGDRVRRFVLERAWAPMPSEMLDVYLVSGYQNPRINVQSILLRHFLIRRLFGDEFRELMEAEIRFAVVLNETLRVRAAELGVKMGSFIDPTRYAEVKRVDEAIVGRDTAFVERWAAALADRRVEPLSVIEFACGSANDYRAFVDYGLARFLDYRGVDLTAKNIANARRRFPGVQFEVGDVVNLRYPDDAVDVVIASDLFEHLAVDVMDRALDEAGRLARHAVVLTFFNMLDIPDHVIRPKGAYHWNRLSRPRVEAHLSRQFGSVSATPIATWLAEQYDYTHSYNRGAWTIVATDDRSTEGGPG
jgi:SAM-dependent methyltransferase